MFEVWLHIGIIEEVAEEDQYKSVNCLPSSLIIHHPVFNEKSSTTPIRPILDAFAKSKDFRSLNDCLEQGQNLLNEIPPMLMKPYATTSDIKKTRI